MSSKIPLTWWLSSRVSTFCKEYPRHCLRQKVRGYLFTGKNKLEEEKKTPKPKHQNSPCLKKRANASVCSHIRALYCRCQPMLSNWDWSLFWCVVPSMSKSIPAGPSASANQKARSSLRPSELANHERQRHAFIVTSRWPAARIERVTVREKNPLFIYLNSLSWWVVVIH